jgi:hypothetical protein
MPTRVLRDSIITSPSLARCAPAAQDRFPRYTLAADDFGCFEMSPVILRGKLFPYRQDMTDDAVAADLAEYQRERMLEVWDENGRQYGFFVSWGRHQRLREKDPTSTRPSKFTSARKTPVPPSVKLHGTMEAYYASDADRAFAVVAPAIPPSAPQQLPGNPPTTPDALPAIARQPAAHCLPQSQSQSQVKDLVTRSLRDAGPLPGLRLAEEPSEPPPPAAASLPPPAEPLALKPVVVAVDPPPKPPPLGPTPEEIAKLEASWPGDLLARVKSALRQTRATGTMSESKWVGFLQEAGQHSREKRVAAAEKYLDEGHHTEEPGPNGKRKNERYLLGMIRNGAGLQRPQQERMPTDRRQPGWEDPPQPVSRAFAAAQRPPAREGPESDRMLSAEELGALSPFSGARKATTKAPAAMEPEPAATAPAKATGGANGT